MTFTVQLGVLGAVLVGSGLGAYWKLRKSHGKEVARRISLVGSTVLALLMITLVGIGLVAPSVFNALPLALGSVMVGAEFWLLASWPHRKRLSGRVLLDTGRSPHFRRHLLGGLATGGLGILAAVTSGPLGLGDALLAAMGLLASSIILSEAVTGTKITERGILRFQRFERWENILTWDWETDEGEVIVTTHRRRYFDLFDARTLLFRRRRWELRSARAEVEPLLREYIGSPASRLPISGARKDG